MALNPAHPATPRLWLVHVWEDGAGFRARARSADDERHQDFNDALALARHLSRPARPSLAAATPATPARSGEPS